MFAPNWGTHFPNAFFVILHTSLHLIKSSRAISRVRCTYYTDVSIHRNVGIIRTPNAADSPRRLYQVHSPRKHQDLFRCTCCSFVTDVKLTSLHRIRNYYSLHFIIFRDIKKIFQTGIHILTCHLFFVWWTILLRKKNTFISEFHDH
jgi:hypothetical protein